MKVEGGGLSENPDETLEIYNGNAFQFLDGLYIGILNLYFNGVPFSRWLIKLQKQYVDNASYLL